ncbi:MAG: hypothetical protein PVJ57_16170 [Phycisphaerae bacterium]
MSRTERQTPLPNTPPPERSHAPPDEWTPLRGLCRAALRGLVLAGLLALPLAFLARTLPHLLILLAPRTMLAFGILWLLRRRVHRDAGMEEWRCSLLAACLAGLVLVSNHVVFALHGVAPSPPGNYAFAFPMGPLGDVVPCTNGLLIGAMWLHPYALLIANTVPLFAAIIITSALARCGDA